MPLSATNALLAYGQRPSITLTSRACSCCGFEVVRPCRGALTTHRCVVGHLSDADVVDNFVVVGHGLDDESAPIRLRSRGMLMRPALVLRKLKGGVLRDDEGSML